MRLKSLRSITIHKNIQQGLKQVKVVIKKILSAIISGLANIMKLMPPKITAVFLGKLQLFGKLDYEGVPIFLKISNTNSLARLNSCRKEIETVVWMEEMADKYSVIYDIGANVGAYSLIGGALLKKKGGKIYAFEPVSSNFSELCENIYYNKLTQNIVPVNIALSDVSDLDYFEANQLQSGSAMHKGLSKRGDNAQQKNAFHKFGFWINKMRLDDFVSRNSVLFPECIKIDVDGHELEVLMGAQATLSDPRCKSIIFEIDKDDPITHQICEFIERKGFILQKENHHRYSGGVCDLVYIR
jgi:FkbM family methyltransferase